MLLITLSSISLLFLTGLDIKSDFLDNILNIVVDSSFLGSFLGALLSGSIALTVLFIQFYNHKKLSVEDDYKKYFKHLYPLAVKMNRFLEELTDEKIRQMVTTYDKTHNNILIGEVVELLHQLDSIDDIIFPEISLDFAVVKLTLSEIKIILEHDLVFISDENDEKIVVSSLISFRLILTSSKVRIDDKIEKAKRILRITE